MKPLLLVLLAACAPKTPPTAPVSMERPTAMPAPLATRPFAAPATQRATLSNGLTVVVAEDHEVPLAWVRLSFRPGGNADPVGKEGLASVTLDLLNEGAGEYDALGLSNALKRLGSDLGSSAGNDGANIWASGLTRNLDATLDLFATVLLEPTFPDSEWELVRTQRIAGLEREKKDPDAIANRVFDRVLFADTYRGRTPTPASYAAITPADMRTWWAQNLTPDRAVLIAGGDLSLETLVPKLEARLAAWKPSGAAPEGVVKVATATMPPAGLAPIHLVDRPGAAQSVLRVGGYVGAGPADADWFALQIANQAVGGQFTARLNMNLREDKGWTYGARSSMGYDLAGTRFVASAPVRTDVTADALRETLAELSGPRDPKPLSTSEVEDARNSIIYAWPLRFESPDYLLGQEEAVWRYGLPADWVSAYVGKVGDVSLDAATAAWKGRVDPDRLVIVVVGDAATVREGLAALGRPLIEHDSDGNVVPAKE